MDLLVSFLKGLGYWGVLFGSAIPLTEQRAAIPLGIWAMGLPPLPVMAASYLGSLLPVPFILIFFGAAIGFMRKFRRLDFLTGFIDRKVRAGSKKIERYKEAGLILFIAIPLPMTGLWTGSAIAAFLGFDFKKSLLCTMLGGAISALAVTAVSVFFPALLGYQPQ
ncbi:MAG: small multi-drug export protein [Clostridiales bacterium]|jgi:uncharacterized membrane protein|nr:small multi-drug export protein [Clostridiales bacterium]